MHSVSLSWKQFTVNLDKVNSHLKTIASSDYDGLICTGDEIKVVFKNAVSPEDQNTVLSYWDALTDTSFLPTLNEIIEKKIVDASVFGKKVIRDAAVENVAMGVTQMGKTKAVADYCAKLQNYLETGSLYAAVDELTGLMQGSIPDGLAPFITNERLNAYKVKIVNYLNG